jgi:hypothetical protein
MSPRRIVGGTGDQTGKDKTQTGQNGKSAYLVEYVHAHTYKNVSQKFPISGANFINTQLLNLEDYSQKREKKQ